jgi:2-(1,2-epoxy-1,2-dihydrophenyl)acetyl-CoA isomerase
MTFETITLAIADQVATLTLNRPERLNAFNNKMLEELRAALDQIRAPGAARCLVITGAGRGFCAGADLSAVPPPSDGSEIDAGETLEKNYNPMILALRALEMPLVAAVNGPCAGAGMSLALACDIVVAARSASFLQAFCNIGLVPDAGSTYFLPRLVGRGRAAGLALLGEKIPAETALEWGMIWKVVDDEALMAEAGAIAKKLANGPTKGLSLIRQALDKSWSNDLATQLDVERNAQRIAGRTQDFAEGVAAFLQKRPARFQGR